MIAKIIGYDLVNFTNRDTGEVISGTRVYYELERDEIDPSREFGNSVDQKFIKNCIPLRVGGEYEIILKPVRQNGRISYDVGGFAELSQY